MRPKSAQRYVEETVKTASLKTQSAWLLFAKVAGFFFTALLPMLIVRFLSQNDVGTYRQVFQIIINAGTILPLGISVSAYYFLSREKERRGASILNILIFNFVVGGAACLTLFFYPQILRNLFRNPEVVRLAPLIGIVIWLWVFSTFLETVAIANQEPRLATAFIILAQLTKTLLMVAAVIVFTSVDAFVYAAIVQAALQTIVLLIYLKSRFPRFWTQFDLRFLGRQLAYALPFGFAGLLWTLQTDVHNYFVGYRFSPAEYAIYAYGCFELPLIAMISESIASVLIPRMSELQSKNDTREMIRLTARAMHKLAFFYFPIYIFLVITAQTFIVTLFTRNYEASVPIFLINITLLPFYIWVVDPVVRSFKELGRMLLVLRIVVFSLLLTALYFGIQYFDLRGMITIVVVAVLFEKFVSSFFVMRKLGVKRSDAFLLVEVAKIAACALIAGAVTFLFYRSAAAGVSAFGAATATNLFGITKISILDFLSGAFVLGICFAIFTPIYLLCANFFGTIDDEDKNAVLSRLSRAAAFLGIKNTRKTGEIL